MNTLFVNMPFGAIRPAIGVSLIKSQLRRIGVPSRVLYLNMWFARRLGAAHYMYLAERTPSQSLAGDWIFSRSAFGARDDADAAYLEAFSARFGRVAPVRDAIAALVGARNAAEAFLEECLAKIDWAAYDVIGFTSTFAQNVASLALARRLKERFPHVTIVFGGANCEAEMGLQLHQSFPFIDYVCSGEADIGFPQLIKALGEGASPDRIRGVIWRSCGRSEYLSLIPERVTDLDTLPHPDYDDYFEQFQEACPDYRPLAGVLMESSRGCWWGEKHHCTFCGLNGTSMTYRAKSAARVLDEITTLCARYRTRFVEMVDNILDMHYFKDLLPEMQRRKLKVGLFYETKANLSKEQIRALHAAGISSIQPGIENLSTDVLRIMRKGTSAIQNVELLKWCKEAGVKVLWNLIYGFPGERPADYEAMPEIVSAILHLQPPFGLGAIRLDRFSPNFTEADRLGITNIRPDRSYEYIYDLPLPERSRLAYYFEHDYADGRVPEQYVVETRKAVRRWQREPEARGLVYVDHGDVLAIWDSRSSVEQALTVLQGSERALYLYCDQNRSLRQIKSQFSEHDGAAIEELLERLVAQRLTLRLDDRYLSLAVLANGPTPSGAGASAPWTDHTLL